MCTAVIRLLPDGDVGACCLMSYFLYQPLSQIPKTDTPPTDNCDWRLRVLTETGNLCTLQYVKIKKYFMKMKRECERNDSTLKQPKLVRCTDVKLCKIQLL
jgi:hypothetical protein